MKKQFNFKLVVLVLILSSCFVKKTDMIIENNPLICDPEKGFCEVSELKTDELFTDSLSSNREKTKIIYFTDPICSSCWGIEAQLRKLKLEYGDYVEIEYRMGGLLPDWSYNSGGISKPSDVASHWDEVSIYYDMPIDGDVWLEDPLNSSYPPSIAFKAAQFQDENKAILFLREIKEMVFLKKENICKTDILELAAKKVALDLTQFQIDISNKAVEAFNTDLKLAKSYGVRGFPTLIFVDSSGKKEQIYGSQNYAVYEKMILDFQPMAKKKSFDKSWTYLFSIYHSMTAKEFSLLSDMDRKNVEIYLNELVEKGNLVKLSTKNGCLWSLRE